ncbi:alpha-L-fucosidase [Vallitalea pronyensis]|nr:alpha-L-fucosidase [Vallitalea pronyensis]
MYFNNAIKEKYKKRRDDMLRLPRTEGVGPFKATDESLKQYQCPQWFRDAKFGIWAHWGPQCVPMCDGWYARNMYMEGSKAYQYHREHYGHPSTFGFKDIIPLWKAETFDPEKLMDKYVAAGAKYFVALGVHVDNYDCWHSKYTKWNAVTLGPKKNIVGMWQEAAKKRGLRFGVSEHLSNYYYWLGPSKLADQDGSHKDILYDGNDPDYADLYFSQVHGTDMRVFNTPDITPAYWQHEWFHRMKDLIDQHDPDLFYIDGGIPFGDVGRQLMAYYYNHNLLSNKKLEGVFNIKNISNLCEYVEGVGTLDLERGVANKITEEPWQIDTCLGNWFYEKGYPYKTIHQVVAFLVDTVSKNGNLLLNVPLMPNGEIDETCDLLLKILGQWLDINGEAIYGTRPWRVYGENIKTKLKATESKNEDDFIIGDRELRFTKKDDVIYVFGFTWPKDGKVRIQAINPSDHVTHVKLLGCNEAIGYAFIDNGLVVNLPKEPLTDIAFTLKVSTNGE